MAGARVRAARHGYAAFVDRPTSCTIARRSAVGSLTAQGGAGGLRGKGVTACAGSRGAGQSWAPYVHHHLNRARGGLSVESEGRREVSLSVDLRLQIGDLLLRESNGIGASDKPA